MKKKLLYLIVLFAVLASCGRGELNSDVTGSININLDELKQRDTLRFSQLFESVDVIVLSDSVLIGDFTNILVHDENIFILDRRIVGVHVFDRKGNYLRQIGSRGEGPGEMLSASGMSIDRINNYIYILDRSSQRINKYSIADGRFLSSITLPRDMAMGDHILYHNNKIYLAQSGVNRRTRAERFLFRILPLNDEDISFIVPVAYNKGWDSGVTNANNYDGPFLFKSDGTPLFTHKFMYVVYEYSNKTLKPYMVLRGNSRNFFNSRELSRLDVNNPDHLFSIFDRNKYHSIHDFIDTDRFLLFTLFRGLGSRIVFYCKENSYAERVGHLIEDMFFNKVDISRRNARFGAKDGKSVLFFICPRDLDFITNRLDSINDDDFVNHMTNLRHSEDFNGVILWYKLK